MTERILVAVAWPYANGSIHIGQVAGAYLPADIFARYHRMKGSDVLMVSGSDAHGTPVTLTAEQRGVTPEQVYMEYQTEFLDNWETARHNLRPLHHHAHGEPPTGRAGHLLPAAR